VSGIGRKNVAHGKAGLQGGSLTWFAVKVDLSTAQARLIAANQSGNSSEVLKLKPVLENHRAVRFTS
jgi:hypothetical protein